MPNSLLSSDEVDQESVTTTNLDQKISDRDALAEQGLFFLPYLITPESASGLAQLMLRSALALPVVTRHKTEYTLYIDSSGGATSSGFALMGVIERIKAHGVKVHTSIGGSAASMALVIAQAGSIRSASPYSDVMMHGPQMFSGWGSVSSHRAASKLHSDTLSNIAKVFAARNSRSHTDPAWWLEHYLCNEDNWFTAEEAQELGLVDIVSF